MVPVRSIFSIFLTLALVYGCATFVYQDGALSFLDAAPLAKVLHTVFRLLCLVLSHDDS